MVCLLSVVSIETVLLLAVKCNSHFLATADGKVLAQMSITTAVNQIPAFMFQDQS